MAVFGAVRIPDDKSGSSAGSGTSKASGRPPISGSPGRSAPRRRSTTSGARARLRELQALARCKPGDCALRLGDRAISRFQTEVDWAAPDAGRRANLLTRQLLLGYAEAYLRGGDAALGAAHNERAPRLVADGSGS
jgi:hypothetical protein